jgi:hypothetical protein
MLIGPARNLPCPHQETLIYVVRDYGHSWAPRIAQHRILAVAADDYVRAGIDVNRAEPRALETSTKC